MEESFDKMYTCYWHIAKAQKLLFDVDKKIVTKLRPLNLVIFDSFRIIGVEASELNCSCSFQGFSVDIYYFASL